MVREGEGEGWTSLSLSHPSHFIDSVGFPMSYSGAGNSFLAAVSTGTAKERMH